MTEGLSYKSYPIQSGCSTFSRRNSRETSPDGWTAVSKKLQSSISLPFRGLLTPGNSHSCSQPETSQTSSRFLGRWEKENRYFPSSRSVPSASHTDLHGPRVQHVPPRPPSHSPFCPLGIAHGEHPQNYEGLNLKTFSVTSAYEHMQICCW